MKVWSAAGLAAAGRDVAAPFRLEGWVAGAPAVLQVEAVLRLLPGRRLVARVSDGTRAPKALKLFYGAGAERYFRRERRGLERLAAAGVATPRLAGEFRAADGAARGLVLEWLDAAEPVTAGNHRAFLEIVRGLARLHRRGAIQADPHLENYLETPDGRVFAVDGDGVRAVHRLTRRRALDNLGLLLAQLAPAYDDVWPAAFEGYSRSRWDRAASPTFAAAAARHARRRRRVRTRRYLAKTLRECSEFRCVRERGRFVACLRERWSPAMAAFADDPDAAFAGADVLKAGNSATVARAVIDRTYVIKRYNVKSFTHGLRRALRPLPRYRNAWRNGHRLHFLGVPTARPVALVERRQGLLAVVAYLVMEDCGSRDLTDAAAAGALDDALVARVAELFRRLAALGLIHGDTKATNFLVHDDRVCLVDLDAMRESGRGQRADVARFLANWNDLPEVRSRFEDAIAAALQAPDGQL